MSKNLPLSYIEISKTNLIHNIKVLKSISKKGTKISAVIKGNAYGHGQNEIAKILEPYVDFFQVNSFLELKLLRKVSKKKTLVFGYISESELKYILKLNCILSIFSLEQFNKLNEITNKLKIKQEIHIPVDALLGREGFLIKELVELFTEIKKSKYIKLTGMYAHFANIEDTNNFTHAKKQIKKYEEALKFAEKYNFKNLDTHISATSGLLVYEKDKGINSVVRLGIGIYGLWPSPHIEYLYKNKLELKPVLSWKTKVAQVKILPEGHNIGYGLTYMTYNPMKIAIIPQGYSDGYDRRLSNKGEVLIGGTRCKILGRVAMNMFVVDVNHLKDIKPEDEVVLIGEQNNQKITPEELGDKIGTINYEITTKISPILPRIIV